MQRWEEWMDCLNSYKNSVDGGSVSTVWTKSHNRDKSECSTNICIVVDNRKAILKYHIC